MVEAFLVFTTHKKETSQKQELLLHTSDGKWDSSGSLSVKLGLTDQAVFSGPV